MGKRTGSRRPRAVEGVVDAWDPEIDAKPD